MSPPSERRDAPSALAAVLTAEAEAQALLADADAQVEMVRQQLQHDLADDAARAEARERRDLAALEAEVVARISAEVDAEVHAADAEVHWLTALEASSVERLADALADELLGALGSSA